MHVIHVAHTTPVYFMLQENVVHENSCHGTMRVHAYNSEVINERYRTLVVLETTGESLAGENLHVDSTMCCVLKMLLQHLLFP